jgi:hypothetical protein
MWRGRKKFRKFQELDKDAISSRPRAATVRMSPARNVCLYS